MASLGDDEFRSLKTTLAIALSQSMFWPGSGGGSAASAGAMKLGASRTFFAAQSVVSANSDGCLIQTSDSSRLFGVNSNGSMFLGSARLIEAQNWYTANSRWVVSSGTVGNGNALSFGTVYDVAPIMAVSGQTSSITFGVPYISAVTAGGATLNVVNLAAANFPTGTWTINWESYGTVTF